MTVEEQFTLHQVEVERWRQDLGDEILRVCYPLTENSVVIDAGGYLGDWTKEINDRYGCTVYVFEPVQKFYDAIRSRLGRRTSVHVHKLALGNSECEDRIYLSGNGSGLHQEGADYEDVRVIDVSGFVCDLTNVDLLKLNVEGAEFEILERLIETGDIRKIDDLQVQFHWFIENGYHKMGEIRAKLSETHECTYAYDLVWENWKRKEQ